VVVSDAQSKFWQRKAIVMSMSKFVGVALLLSLSVGFVGCGDSAKQKQAMDDATKAVQDAGKAAKEATDAATEKMNAAGQQIKAEAEAAKAKLDEAAKNVKEAAEPKK
jgi:hypothetical protein